MSFHSRLRKVQQALQEASCDALLVEDGINLFYLTGLNLSAGTLIAHAEGAHLFVDNRYFELCQKNSPFPVVLANQNTVQDFLDYQACAYIRTVGINSDTITVKAFQELEKQIGIDRLILLDNPIKKIRSIKDEGEIALLKKAAFLGSQGFDFAKSLLRVGIMEKEIALELEIYWKKLGSKGLAFDPIIAFGANSSMPHYRAGDAKLISGQPVLIDIGVNLQHYHSDMTRMVFFDRIDPKMKLIYQIVLEAQLAALEQCRPGVPVGHIDIAARQIIQAAGHGEHFTHSIGHGVGLEIHEFPSLRNKPPYSALLLEPGMVITIEPGIYLPGIGGVRIEDTVVITQSGYENLTNRTKELSIL